MLKVKPQEEDESQLKNTAGSTRSHGREQWPHTPSRNRFVVYPPSRLPLRRRPRANRPTPENTPQPSRPKPLGALPRSAPSLSSCARSSSRPAARPSAQRSAAWAQAAHTRSQTWSLDRARPTRRSQPPLLPARGAHRGGLRSLWRASALRRATSLTATRTASRLCSSSRRRSVRHSVRRSVRHSTTACRALHAEHHARVAYGPLHAAHHARRFSRRGSSRTKATLHAHYGTLHAAYALLLPRAQDKGVSGHTHHYTHHELCSPLHSPPHVHRRTTSTRANYAHHYTYTYRRTISTRANYAHHYTYTYRRTTSTRASPTITPSPHSSRPCCRRACMPVA